METRKHIVAVDNGVDGAYFYLDPNNYESAFFRPTKKRKMWAMGGNTIDMDFMKNQLLEDLRRVGAIDSDRPKSQHSREVLLILEKPLMNIAGGRASKTAIASGVASSHIWQHILRDIQDMYGVALTSVGPQKWQNKFWAPKKKDRDTPHASTKELSIRHATALFPWLDFRKTARSVRLFDGATDAALLAKYAIMQNL